MSTNGPPKERKTLHHEAHRLPVTALAFCAEDILLSGEGTRLNGFNVQTKTLLGSVQIFPSQAIHGIVVDSNSKWFIIYGGRYLRPARLVISDLGAVTFLLGKTLEVGDWIFDASLGSTREDSDLVLAIVTAHNALYIARSPKSHEVSDNVWTIRSETPRSNTILYAAHVTWLSPARLLIAAGTAFGDVVLWSYQVDTTQGELASSVHGTSQIHYTFSAHEGSVFGVFISPLVKDGLPNAATRFLATCSDDRSIRIWDISDLSCQSASLVEKARDTGFGAKLSENESSPTLLARTMAHTSRIWTVRMINFQSGDVQLMSFGEDATAISWRMARSISPDGLPCQLSQIQVDCPHSGKNIWSTAFHTSGVIATGGADGAIALIEHDSKRSSCIVDISRELSALHEGDSFKSYAFVNRDTLFAITHNGRIVTAELGAQNMTTARELSHLPTLRNYSIVTGLPSVAFAGSADGHVYAYLRGSNTVVPLTRSARKITGLFASEMERSSDVSEVVLLIANVNATEVEVRIYRLDMSEGEPLSVQSTSRLELPASFIVTSFTRIPDSLQRSLVILGSRQGSLAVFALTQERSEGPLVHHYLIPEVHGSEAVTSLRWLPVATSCSGQDCLGHLFSTGRDGTYAVHRISKTKEQSVASLQLVHQLELPFGPNIEEIFINDDCEVLVWGFKSKHFVVYSITSHREIMTVNCGGAHRNWAFNLAASGQGGTFVWTKAAKINRFTQDAMPWSLINAGGHGREIKTMAVWRRAVLDALFATGAEDTDIRIFSVDPIDSRSESPAQPNSRRLRLVQLLRKHNTGPQHLAFSSCGKYLFSSGGFEEFFVWRIEHDIPGIGIGVVCESAHPRSGSSDLRITSFDIRQSQERGGKGTVWQTYLAYSDSSIAIWTYDALGRWQHQAAVHYLTACLTHVLDLSPSVEFRDHFITTATDGHIALWSSDPVTDEMSPRWTERHRAHQSAIQSALVHRLSDGSWLSITGGDDNAISLTRLTITAQSPERWSTLTIPRAHAAAVTALALVRAPADDLGRETLCLLSAGLDQRVRVWNVKIDVSKSRVDGVEVEKVGNAFINVADVAALGVIVDDEGGDRESTARVVVAGVGVEILRLRPPSTEDC